MSRVLVDTSVWIDHLHAHDEQLATLLDAGLVVTHEFVIGELALGSIRNRAAFLSSLSRLPAAPVVSGDELLTLVERRGLHGRGVSLVDAHLLASTLVSGDVRLWTRDKRLRVIAVEAGVSWNPGR